jgi:putative membrane protein
MRYLQVLLLVFLLVLLWSAIAPKDYFTWFLEVFPALIGLTILISTFKTFRLTDLAYTCILLHCCILFIGGHYTYAEVPLFDHIRDFFGHSRNNYDKIGHFAQGFVPAIIIREILIRKQVILRKGWLHFIIVSICLAISAAYEFLEWFVSAATGEAGDSFLGTQGDVWDTQSDMLTAMIGAIVCLAVLGKWHNRQLEALNKNKVS